MTLAGTRMGASPLLSSDEVQALEAATLPVRSVKAGADLLREREPGDRLYVITAGWACRYLTSRDGMRQISALLVPGDTANIDTLSFECPDYGVRALTALRVVAMPRYRALALAAEHVGIASTFLTLALLDNAILSQWTLCLGRLSARQRLAHLLCELGARLDPDGVEESSYEMPMTQEQLSDALGLTSVHINRTLQQLRSEGLVVTERRTLTIPDVARLRIAGEFDPAYLHRHAAGAVTRQSSPNDDLDHYERRARQEAAAAEAAISAEAASAHRLLQVEHEGQAQEMRSRAGADKTQGSAEGRPKLSIRLGGGR